MSQSILRFRRTDHAAAGAAAFVILHLQSNGSAPLDLSIVGTDNEYPFTATIKQTSIKSLQSSNYQGTDDEWTSILSALLLHRSAHPTVTQGLEAVASLVDNGKVLTLSIRKNIGGIMQRLGVIPLVRNEVLEPDIFNWVGVAAQSADGLRAQLADLQSSMSNQQQTVQHLTAQLEALVATKKTHEEELINKFAALLNSKKSKIRDQQRLLAHAKIDPKAATKIQQTRSSSVRKPDVSRLSKRKANALPSDSETTTDDDKNASPPAATPEQTDDETEGETDQGEFDPAPMPSQASRRGTAVNGGGLSSSTSQSQTIQTTEDSAAQMPPPRRELPFAKKPDQRPSQSARQPSAVPTSSYTSSSATANTAPVSAEVETDEEETDDEL